MYQVGKLEEAILIIEEKRKRKEKHALLQYLIIQSQNYSIKMKKFLGILVLGLLVCCNSFAGEINV